MAYSVEKKSPVDLSGRKAVGVKLPFSSNSVFTSTFQTVEAYKTNLINFLLTDRGERYLNPDFGCSLRSLLFEPELNNIGKEGIKNNLLREITMYFPRLIVDTLSIESVAEHVEQVYLKFHIKDSRVEDELVVNFE